MRIKLVNRQGFTKWLPWTMPNGRLLERIHIPIVDYPLRVADYAEINEPPPVYNQLTFQLEKLTKTYAEYHEIPWS